MSILNANASQPRRVLRAPIAVAIDLTVTPPYAGAVAGQIKSGEALFLTANKKVASLATAGTSNANAANFVGVAQDAYPYPYAESIYGGLPGSDPNLPTITVYEDGDHAFNTTAGDTYNPYDALYLGADGRTVQKTALGTSIGYVSPDQRTGNAPFFAVGIAGGSGVQIYVRIKPALA